ncbi:putative dehydrogenase [Mucilaginibacter yixingensis]|uniref:Putative dehydrogenase n=1 Tax=Mucilaginibacter yixingensis TaxID=1295612 RepID=A0A2T5J8X7_9SPHI|nr:Gfo/Idh/MocA family oxidoreductase [Mucilaginibacter yixingensis]PTQ95901.1 putative dehydrogenase [Mucilaginibacter yixingensis]
MSSPIVTGILSYGMSGRLFQSPFVNAHPGFKFKAVVERSKKKAAERYPDVISYDSVDELLADKEIELVIVNTPGYTHFDFAMQSLKAGKNVLIEKPASGTVEQVKALYDEARARNLNVMVYQNRRWDSDFQSVKQVVESGRLGRLIEAHFRFDRYSPALSPKAFKEDAELGTNGLVYDLGPHLLDQVISLFGRPLSFNKQVGINREDSTVIDYFSIQLSYPNQLNVFVTSSLLVAQPLPSFVVHGTLGSYIKERCDVQEEQLDKEVLPDYEAYGIEPAGSEGVLITIGPDKQKITEHIASTKGNYMHLFDAVYHTIRNGALYPITEEHVAWQMEIIEA